MVRWKRNNSFIPENIRECFEDQLIRLTNKVVITSKNYYPETFENRPCIFR